MDNREELISAYLDGELSDEEQQQVMQLLSEDEAARQLFADFQSLRSSLRSSLRALPADPVDHAFSKEVLERVEQVSPEQPKATPSPAPREPTFRPRMLLWPAMAIAAAIMLMVFYEEPTSNDQQSLDATLQNGLLARLDDAPKGPAMMAKPQQPPRPSRITSSIPEPLAGEQEAVESIVVVPSESQAFAIAGSLKSADGGSGGASVEELTKKREFKTDATEDTERAQQKSFPQSQIATARTREEIYRKQNDIKGQRLAKSAHPAFGEAAGSHAYLAANELGEERAAPISKFVFLVQRGIDLRTELDQLVRDPLPSIKATPPEAALGQLHKLEQATTATPTPYVFELTGTDREIRRLIRRLQQSKNFQLVSALPVGGEEEEPLLSEHENSKQSREGQDGQKAKPAPSEAVAKEPPTVAHRRVRLIFVVEADPAPPSASPPSASPPSASPPSK